MPDQVRHDGQFITYRFDRFTLDTADRRLLEAGAPVELNARYFDALALLVREGGALVTKDRFMDEVWSGIPVTDEALTQCIRTLRKRLGDDAARPRFIETVPKHGYRFVAPVEAGEGPAPAAAPPPRSQSVSVFFRLAAAGTIGGRRPVWRAASSTDSPPPRSRGRRRSRPCSSSPRPPC